MAIRSIGGGLADWVEGAPLTAVRKSAQTYEGTSHWVEGRPALFANAEAAGAPGPSGTHYETFLITESLLRIADTLLTKAETITISEFFAGQLIGPAELTVFDDITISEFVNAVLSAVVQAGEDITITEAIATALLSILPADAGFETLTIAEALTVVLSPMVVRVHETLTLTENLNVPFGLIEIERLYITEYLLLQLNPLVLRVHETLDLSESGLNSTGPGASGGLGPDPSPITPGAGRPGEDYWVVGI